MNFFSNNPAAPGATATNGTAAAATNGTAGTGIDKEKLAIDAETFRLEDEAKKAEKDAKLKEEAEEEKINHELENLQNEANAMKVIGATTMVAELIHLTILGAETVTHLAEIVPLAGVAFVMIGKLIEQYKAYVELTSLLEDVGDLVKSCGMMAKVTIKTMKLLETEMTTFFVGNPNETQGHFAKIIEKISKFKINADIGIKIKTKLKQLNVIFDKLNLENKDKGFMSKIGNFFTKSTQGNFYKEMILKEMTILNMLFVVSNNQLTWTLSMNEHYLKNIIKSENDVDIYLMDNFWDKLLESQEFNDYWEIKNENTSGLFTVAQKGGRRRRHRRNKKSRKLHRNKSKKNRRNHKNTRK